MKITATGMLLTSGMRQRIEWVCKKIEKRLGVHNNGALLCDIALVKVSDEEYRVAIYLTGPEVALSAAATATSAISALDNAHDEVERTFFSKQGKERSKQRIRDFAVRQALRKKKTEEEKRMKRKKEPPRRVKGRAFGEKEEIEKQVET